jgi:hypothetical protein
MINKNNLEDISIVLCGAAGQGIQTVIPGTAIKDIRDNWIEK